MSSTPPTNARDHLFRSMPFLACLTDLDGRVIEVNDAWRLLGWSPEVLVGRSMISLVHPDDQPEARGELQALGTVDGYHTRQFRCSLLRADHSFQATAWTAFRLDGLPVLAAFGHDTLGECGGTDPEDAGDGRSTFPLGQLQRIPGTARGDLATEAQSHALRDILAARRALEDVIETETAPNPGSGGDSIDGIVRLLDSATAALRRALTDIASPYPDGTAMGEALEAHARRLTEHWPVEFRIDVALPDDLDAEERTSVYRIACEAMTNAAKHAGAVRVSVAARHCAMAATLRVADDGCGMSIADSAAGRTTGMLLMRHHARRLGARWSLRSAPGCGTAVELAMPLGRSIRRSNPALTAPPAPGPESAGPA